MDEIEFARENLRRQMMSWATDTLPSMMEKRDEMEREKGEDGGMPTALIDAILLMSFPIDAYTEYRDLVAAKMKTLRPDETQDPH